MSKMGYLINPDKKHILDDDLSYEFNQRAIEKNKKAAEERSHKEETV